MMKLFTASLLLLSSFASAVDFLSIHGSGTTNPSKCYWAIMNELESQSKLPLRMSYRAVGSTTGQKEFLNNDNAVESATYFGSGDLPMTAERYKTLSDLGVEMVHLPAFIGAVSWFHNVEGVHHLNLTAEILADIYSFEITDWNDDRIKEHNPNMNLPAGADTTIVPVRREHGSSSTSAATEVSSIECWL